MLVTLLVMETDFIPPDMSRYPIQHQDPNSSDYHGGAIEFAHMGPLHRHLCCPESG